MITNNETKNLGDFVQATELNSGIEVTGLANLAMALITACNYKNMNVIKVKNRASSQIEKSRLVITIINNNLSNTQIQKAMDLFSNDHNPIRRVIEHAIGVGDGNTSGPTKANRLDRSPNPHNPDPHII